MALARNEPGGQGSENFVALNLNLLAQECTLNWIQTALEKNIDLGFDGAPAIEQVLGDANT